jgi:hypothetical protein
MSETNLSNRQGRMALSLALLVLLCAAPTKARADVTQLSCIQTGDREYKLSYSFTANTHSVQIFASTSSEPNASNAVCAQDKAHEHCYSRRKSEAANLLFL